MGKKKSQEEFEAEIKQISPEIKIIGRYTGMAKHIDCECLVCKTNWSPVASTLKNGSKCPACTKKRMSEKFRKRPEVYKEEIENVNPDIELLEEYQAAAIKIKCRCKACGNVWSTKANNLLNGEGCKVCGIKHGADKIRKTHEEFCESIKRINPTITIKGRYVRTKDRINVRCDRCGHEWSPRAGELIAGNGCPVCGGSGSSYAEQFILATFRTCLGFENVLSRDRKTIGKEIDILIPSLNTGIEIGSYHWHKDKLDSDYEKKRECENKGIHLIVIYDSFKEDTAYACEFADYIFQIDLGSESGHHTLIRLTKELLSSLNIVRQFTEKEWNAISNLAYIGSKMDTTEDFKKKVASVVENVEITGEYRGANTNIDCKCKKCGNTWSARPANLLRQKTGCKVCASRKNTQDYIKSMSVKHPEIEVLGEYKTCEEKIKVKCMKCGHVWNANAENLLNRGKGCPACNGGVRYTFSEIHEILKDRNPNILLLGEYISRNTPALVKCKICGHEWDVKPACIINKNRPGKCPVCRRKDTEKTRKEETEKRRMLRIGETSINISGYRMTIIEYRNTNDIDIRFDDGTVVKHTSYTHFKDGKIRKPKIFP